MKGFTLIEAIFGITLTAIVLIIGVPSIRLLDLSLKNESHRVINFLEETYLKAQLKNQKITLQVNTGSLKAFVPNSKNILTQIKRINISRDFQILGSTKPVIVFYPTGVITPFTFFIEDRTKKRINITMSLRGRIRIS